MWGCFVETIYFFNMWSILHLGHWLRLRIISFVKVFHGQVMPCCAESSSNRKTPFISCHLEDSADIMHHYPAPKTSFSQGLRLLSTGCTNWRWRWLQVVYLMYWSLCRCVYWYTIWVPQVIKLNLYSSSSSSVHTHMLHYKYCVIIFSSARLNDQGK